MGQHRSLVNPRSLRGRRIRVAVLSLLASLGLIVAVAVSSSAAPPPHDPMAGQRMISCRTDADGVCTVRHRLGIVPASVEVTPRIPKHHEPYGLSVVPGSLSAARFLVRAIGEDGMPKAHDLIRFRYWLPDLPITPETILPSLTTAPPAATTTTTPPTTTQAPTTTSTPTPITRTATPPTGTPGPVCGTAALDGGPASPPDGAVRVPAGDNSGVDFQRPGVTYWFAPGVHTLGGGEYDQIVPGDNATFVGAPGAVLDGGNTNRYAFTQHARGVTIRYLTIRNFVAPVDEGVVNHDSGNGWTIAHNTLIDNAGAAMMAGSGQRIIGNCVRNNGQYGLNAFQAGNQARDILLQGNEFVGNNADDVENQIPGGCGCTGAMKFWSVDGADIVGNWIHDNHGPGIWADTNNDDFLIERNLIERNDGQALFYEISYNVVLRDNVVRHNTWVTGREFANRNDTFPIGTVYLSEAGGEPRVGARTSVVEITGNRFVNNWGGIAAWENADRFCGTNTTAECTLLIGENNGSRCAPPAINTEPRYSDCRWKTQRLRVHGNVFVHEPPGIDGGCPARFCGVSALFANYGTVPEWSPYKGRVVQQAITFEQDNRWYDNDYTGPWRFVPYETGRSLTLPEWQAAPYHQDAGSS